MIHNLFNLIVLLIQRFLSMIARNIAKTLWKKKFDFNNKSKRRNLMKFRSTIFHPICRNIRWDEKSWRKIFQMPISTLLVSTEQGHRSATRANSSQADEEKEGEGEETRVEAGRRRWRERERERGGRLSLSLCLSSRWEMRRHNR